MDKDNIITDEQALHYAVKLKDYKEYLMESATLSDTEKAILSALDMNLFTFVMMIDNKKKNLTFGTKL